MIKYLYTAVRLIWPEKYYVASSESREMLYHHKKTGCPYLRNILKENKKQYKTSYAAEKDGYRICRICNDFLTQKKIFDFK